MEIFNLKYFISLWDNKSFSKAAEEVHISQPALTQCLKKMENEIGTPLLVRNGHRIQLTEAGELVYSYGKRIIELHSNLSGALSEIIHKGDLKIRVGMSPFYSKYYLPNIIPFVREQYPNISIETEEDISNNLEKKLINGDLDFCCLPQDPEIEGLTYETICIEEILLAVPASSPINQHAESSIPLPCLDIKNVVNQKFVSLKSIQKINRLIEGLCLANGIDYNVVYETLDWETVNIMIGSGVGVGFVPDILYSGKTGDNIPVYYRIPNQNLQRRYSIAYNSRKTFSDTERLMISVFKSRIQEIRSQRITYTSTKKRETPE